MGCKLRTDPERPSDLSEGLSILFMSVSERGPHLLGEDHLKFLI